MANIKNSKKGNGYFGVFLIIAGLAVGWYCFYGPARSAEAAADAMDTLDTVQQEVESQYLDYDGKVSEADAEDVLREYYDKVSDIKGVSDCRLNDDCVAIELKDGTRYVYAPEVKGLDAGGGMLEVATYEPYHDDFLGEPADGIYVPSVFEDTGAMIEYNYSGALSWENSYYDYLVTLDSLLEMEQNKIIIWNGHGLYDTKFHSIICTDIPWDDDVPERYRDDLLILSGSSGKHIGIPAEFIENQMEDGALDGSIVYLGICSGAKDDHLMEAFEDKGARTVFGFTGTVHHSYDENMAFELLAVGMAEPDVSTSDALALAKNTYGSYDTGTCSGTELTLYGDSSYTIGEMIDLYGPDIQTSPSYDIPASQTDPGYVTQTGGVLTEDDVLGYWTTDENDDEPEVVQVYKDGGMLKYRMFWVMPDTDGDHYIFEANDGEAELMSNLESLFCYGSDGSIYASFFCDNIDEDVMDRQEYEQTWYRWNGFPYEDVVRDNYGY